MKFNQLKLYSEVTWCTNIILESYLSNQGNEFLAVSFLASVSIPNLSDDLIAPKSISPLTIMFSNTYLWKFVLLCWCLQHLWYLLFSVLNQPPISKDASNTSEVSCLNNVTDRSEICRTARIVLWFQNVLSEKNWSLVISITPYPHSGLLRQITKHSAENKALGWMTLEQFASTSTGWCKWLK